MARHEIFKHQEGCSLRAGVRMTRASSGSKSRVVFPACRGEKTRRSGSSVHHNEFSLRAGVKNGQEHGDQPRFPLRAGVRRKTGGRSWPTSADFPCVQG